MANTYLSKRDSGKVREKKSVVIEQELDRLVEEHGTITPQMVLEEGRDSKSPLHKFFEWDDTKAAEKYRLAQAYAMIQATKFVVFLNTTSKEPPQVSSGTEVRKLIPAFGKGEGFKMRNEVLAEPDARQALIERKKSVLKSWCKSVVDLPELATLRALIESRLSDN